MNKSVTFRLAEDKLQEIDQLATMMDRDRSYLINEAVEGYLEIQRWQLEGIDQAIAEADAGRFATDEEVKRVFVALKGAASA